MFQINQQLKNRISNFPDQWKYMGCMGERAKGTRNSENVVFKVAFLDTQLQILRLFPLSVWQYSKPTKIQRSHNQYLLTFVSIAFTTFTTIFSCIVGNAQTPSRIQGICRDTQNVKLADDNSCALPSNPTTKTQVIKSYELTNNIFTKFTNIDRQNHPLERYTNTITSEQKADFFSLLTPSDVETINFPSCRDCTYLPLEISQASLQQDNTPATSPPNDPPPLEGQPNLPTSSPAENSPLTNPPTTTEDKFERLRRSLQKTKQPNQEESQGELGVLRVRQLESPPPLEQPSLPETPKAKPQPTPAGYFIGNVGYFATSNIFSAEVDPIQDSLFYAGLTLASAPIRLGKSTILNGSIDGYLIRYLNQSKFSYNQIRFNLNLYQQLTSQMYAGIGWSHQNLFYAQDGSFFAAGDRFLKEDSLTFSLSRRDTITPKLFLDSFYEFRYSFADPDNRNRLINSLWLSLKYDWQKPIQVGLNYQFNFSDFTKRDRDDSYHRLYANLNYALSKTSNINLQGGVALGSSTDDRIDFDGWFFSINYGWELGRF